MARSSHSQCQDSGSLSQGNGLSKRSPKPPLAGRGGAPLRFLLISVRDEDTKTTVPDTLDQSPSIVFGTGHAEETPALSRGVSCWLLHTHGSAYLRRAPGLEPGRFLLPARLGSLYPRRPPCSQRASVAM